MSHPSAHWFWVPEASTTAARVDHLFFFVLSVSALLAFGVTAAIIFFCIRYRRRPERTLVPNLKKRSMYAIEAAWILIPLGLCMVMFFWGADVYVEGAVFPQNAEEVLVVAKQWMWKLQHVGGQREINELHVPIGRRIRLIMTSQDVVHSFYVPEFRAKMDVLPGRYTSLWFTATETGTFNLLCAQYCGTEHARMRGKVIVMGQSEFAHWLNTQAARKSPASLGAELFTNHGCVACHQSDKSTRAPTLNNLYGSVVILSDGTTVTADENYIRESITNPMAKLVAGYQPIMPDFRGSLTDEEVLDLVAYIKTLGTDAGGSR